MGLPAKRRTNTSKRQRASHFALKKITVAKCSQCDSPTLPHRACKVCGYYRDKKGVDKKKRTERRMRHIKKVK